MLILNLIREHLLRRARHDASALACQRKPRYVHPLRLVEERVLINIPAGCGEVVAILDECHARGFLWKAVGMCNAAKRDVTKCLRAERLERTMRNREMAKEKKAQVIEKWTEIEQNS